MNSPILLELVVQLVALVLQQCMEVGAFLCVPVDHQDLPMQVRWQRKQGGVGGSRVSSSRSKQYGLQEGSGLSGSGINQILIPFPGIGPCKPAPASSLATHTLTTEAYHQVREPRGNLSNQWKHLQDTAVAISALLHQ